MAKDYTLKVVPVPVKRREGLYDIIVADFIANVLDNKDVRDKAAEVSMPGRSVKTVQIGLSKAVKMSGRKDVRVIVVDSVPYLAKK